MTRRETITRITVLVLLFTSTLSVAQTLSVCEVLMNLDSLNGKEVSVRGSWSPGLHGGGGFLLTPTPCDKPTIRLGWMWDDGIAALPDPQDPTALPGSPATLELKSVFAQYNRLYKRIEEDWLTQPARVVATLFGRLETSNRLLTGRSTSRSSRPNGYGHRGVWVALLRYRKVDDLVITSYKSGELQWELELRRRPGPKSVVDRK
jgi:hypothetical protein